jgi:transcriptional regulator with XRE-family HTH domain
MELDIIIKKYRKDHNLTSKQLAELVGVSQGTISNIETGKTNPSFENIKKIANIVDMPKEIISSYYDINESLVNHFGDIECFSFDFDVIHSKIYQRYELNDSNIDDKNVLIGKASLEGSIIANVISTLLKENESKIISRVKNELNKELDSMLEEYKK